jgi:thiol-disulfide isomerase/thioredoxin
MNSILFLNSEDFFVEGPTLRCRIDNGPLYILFYSTDCPHCKTALPAFRALPNSFPSHKFGLINISNNPSVVHKSKQSDTPIKYVPSVILYHNGSPHFRFTSKITLDNLRSFVLNTAKIVPSKQKFVSQENEEEKEIPAYTVGKPYCDGDVCYINYDQAYPSKK